ncbi:FAD binding domain-containing protein, partial [Colletotrichum tamarilloi]
DPNTKFANIRDIHRAQIEAGEKEVITAESSDSECPSEAGSCIVNFLAHHHEINQELGLATEFVYMGDAGEWQKPFPAYGQGNLQKMKDIRAQYDPNMVFSKLNWGGFKLGH